ncbi:sulfite exporter TauE/SafE family protein [Staphylococcus sp. SQ8-PEA]|uniref:Probable membrane transporter protein n=1 Tax=Staphylococcus marylandisciuri TaxID=2981529 RepID=A0ABT2QPM8_9STAP|nr:sulfite exporter TauE/SafE family protein [Staphylococcus marylandisciuri]MCU5745929.1 sulfite exporter TauE/SafE family protein [Staphylococcus marylandisciuri]
MLTIICLILIGALSAILGSLVGIGGGIIIVPTLIYLGVDHHLLKGITPQIAIGTSSIILIVTGLSSTIGYMKAKQVDFKNGSVFLFGLVPGSLIGAILSRYLTLHSFNLYFGIFLIFVAILLIIRNKIKPIKIFSKEKYRREYTDNDGHTYHYYVAPLFAFVVTLLIGILTGLFGIGGGALMTPLMLLVFRFPPHVAVGTSMLMIFFSSLTSSIGHVAQGHVAWSYSIVLIISSYLGARLGVKINRAVKSDTVVLLLRTVLLIMGAYLIIKSFL